MSADPPSADLAVWLRRLSVLLGVVALAAVLWGAYVWWSAERSIDRQSLDSITDRNGDGDDDGEGAADGGDDDTISDVLNVLVVGSDTREGLTEEQRKELSTGNFDGEQTDTILLVQTTPDGQSILSFPRDLKVQVGEGEPTKINSVLEGHGRDMLISVVEDAVGVQVDHYVEVAIPSFLEIVDAAGGVEICLEEPLRDRKSGADFEPGCHHMDGTEALSYVRSREGRRSDYARVERQQIFLRELADRATSLSVLSNPLRLRNVVTSVSEGLTVDEELTVGRMLELANGLRQRLDEGLEVTALPSYPSEERGIAYVVAYPPGVREMALALQTASPLPEHPPANELADLGVGIWSDAAPDEASVIESVLYFGGFVPEVLGPSPLDDVRRTTVYHATGAQEQAGWVAGLLGAPIAPLPAEVEPPEGFDVFVVARERERTVGGVLAPPA